jgi:hypothetical protein
LSLLALLSGPLLVPLLLNTDVMIAIHAGLSSPNSISGWYGPGAWVAYVLTALAALAHLLKLAWHVKTRHSWTWRSPDCKGCPCVDRWDGDLLVALVYTLFSVYDLVHHSLLIVHAGSIPFMHPQAVPALQAAATASYVGFGATYVLIIVFTFLVSCTWQGSLPEVIKAHWRRGIVLGTMLIIVHTGVSVCEHTRSTMLLLDASRPALFLPSRLTNNGASVFSVVSEILAPMTWIKILSVFSTLTGPIGSMVIYGSTVYVLLFMQSAKSSPVTLWNHLGATLVFAYVWPLCLFVLVMYLVVLVS